MNQLYAEIRTPERSVFSGVIQSVKAPAHGGYIEILFGHEPLICRLRSGELRIRDDKGDRLFFQLKEGVMEVFENKVQILCEAIQEVKKMNN